MPSPHLVRTAANPELFFKGRAGDPRWGEWAQPIDTLSSMLSSPGFVLIGCADDTGVTLNRGRAGAKFGPDGIRKHLYKMALPSFWRNNASFYDLGNLIPSRDILETHRSAKDIAQAISEAKLTPIFLGGGHDFAAPHFQGFSENRKNPGLINVDPHLDVRELENGRPHSGTPFRQILQTLKGKNLIQFGARKARNAESHFQFCKEIGVQIFELETIRKQPLKAEIFFSKQLRDLKNKCQWMGLSIDMDCCSDGDGVSAAPVVGFSAWELVSMAAFAGTTKQVEYLEIAEVAPPLDPLDRTSRIAAEIIFAFIQERITLHSNPHKIRSKIKRSKKKE